MKKNHLVTFILLILVLIGSSCNRENQNFHKFTIDSAPEEVKAYEWRELAKDKEGDGSSPDSADGRALSYFYEKENDRHWFKFDLYSPINTVAPAVSLSIDSNADQSDGIDWFGANSEFKFEKMVSVGPTQETPDGFIGYNGITDARGVRERNWINVRQ